MNSRYTWRSVLSNYIFALVITGLAFIVSMLIYSVIQRIPAVLFFCAILLSAWRGGVGAGLVASLLSMLALDFYFIEPLYQWSITPESLLTLLVYLLATALTSAAVGMQSRAQRLITAHREWLQTTLSSIGDAVIVTDTASRVTFLNTVAETLTGWAAAEAMGQPISTVFHIVNEETRLVVENPTVRVLREGIIVGLANHTILISKQGKDIPIDDSGAPVLDNRGNITGSVLVFRDITEQRKQQRLAAQLAAIVEGSDDAIVGKDLNGIITSWNQGAEHMYGYAATEMIGKSVDILIPPDLPNDVPEILERIRHGERVIHYETKRMTKDGHVLDVALTVSPIHDSYGKVVGASKIARDITERKQRERDLKQSLENEQSARIDVERANQRLEFLAKAGQLLSSSLDYDTTFNVLRQIILPDTADIYSIDMVEPDGLFRRVAMAATDAATERLVHDLEARTPPQRLLNNPTLSAGKTLLFEAIPAGLFERNAQDSEHLAIFQKLNITSEIIVPLRIRENIIGILTVVRQGIRPNYTTQDVTLMEELALRIAQTIENARLYNESKRAIALRDEFLSVAAHELRTPVTSLRGFAQLLARQHSRTGTFDPQRITNAITHIDEQSSKLAVLINQLLDISRVEAGRLTLDRQVVNISSLLEDIVKRIQSATDKHELRLQANGTVELNADPIRLEQVVLNLLDNAVKYSPEGGLIVVDVTRPTTDSVAISVRDHGLGIPPEHRSRLFERFYQAHEKGFGGGMGLGLYISRQIVELHGGQLMAEFPAEGGTRFVITLPIGEAVNGKQ